MEEKFLNLATGSYQKKPQKNKKNPKGCIVLNGQRQNTFLCDQELGKSFCYDSFHSTLYQD